MDSKYSILAKSKPESSPFSQKRKFVYGSGNSAPQPKRPNLQNSPKLTNPLSKQVNAQNGSSNIVNRNANIDIQLQRQQLPVYAVREPYVHLTTISFICYIWNGIIIFR